MNTFIEEVKALQEKFERLYVYGAGSYGQKVCKILQENQIKVHGFAVTNNIDCNLKYTGEVSHIDEIDMENAAFVVGAGYYNSMEIMKTLKEKRCDDSRIICAYEYLNNRKIDEEYYTVPSIDITTVIGCKVNCKYCPQTLLLKNYFKDDSERDSVMTMETFRACMLHLPRKSNLVFAGMAEPFLNPNCADMILCAYEAGMNVELYTTLVGATEKDLEKIWDIPMEYVNLHVADRNGYANIPTTDSFFELVKKVINHQRADGLPFVSLCSAQCEPHPRIRELYKGNVLTDLHDRAGNLEGEKLSHRETPHGCLSCAQSGQMLNHNELLPDGTLLLCCMDFGMKHVLGNLKDMSYEEIVGGKSFKKIKTGFMGDEKIDILCRKCSFAREVD